MVTVRVIGVIGPSAVIGRTDLSMARTAPAVATVRVIGVIARIAGSGRNTARTVRGVVTVPSTDAIGPSAQTDPPRATGRRIDKTVRTLTVLVIAVIARIAGSGRNTARTVRGVVTVPSTDATGPSVATAHRVPTGRTGPGTVPGAVPTNEPTARTEEDASPATCRTASLRPLRVTVRTQIAMTDAAIAETATRTAAATAMPGLDRSAAAPRMTNGAAENRRAVARTGRRDRTDPGGTTGRTAMPTLVLDVNPNAGRGSAMKTLTSPGRMCRNGLRKTSSSRTFAGTFAG